MSELKPCPFCGSEPRAQRNGAVASPYWEIACDMCDITCHAFDTKAEAIAAWNRRASPPPSAAGEWQTVPKEPTEEMLRQFDGLDNHRNSKHWAKIYWSVLLAAAPPPPGSEPSSALAEAMEVIRQAERALNHGLKNLPFPIGGKVQRAWSSLVEARDAIEAFLASHSKGE